MPTSKPPRRVPANGAGSDGNPMRNLILLGLPADEIDSLRKKLVFVELPTKFVLLEAAQPIKFVRFMSGGLASVLNMMTDGKSVEVGLAGKEGFVGLPIVVGVSTSATRVIIQVKGSAYRMTSKDFVEILPQCPELEKHLNRFALHLGNQAIHVATCNRLHEVDERLARWLLMSQDRLGGNIVPLTQEFLAHMLGTRRASVTVAAGILQKSGLITYTRGEVKIDNRTGLEDAVCECYAAMTEQMRNWEKEADGVGTLPD